MENSKETLNTYKVEMKVVKNMSEEIGFKEKLDQDIKKRERFFTDLYLTDFSNWLGIRDTERIEKEGYVLYIADGYMVNAISENSGRGIIVDEDVLYYVLVVKFMSGYKVMLFEYSSDVLVEINKPSYSFFIKQTADVNSVISSAYHISIILAHTFYNITEYYTDIISNIK